MLPVAHVFFQSSLIVSSFPLEMGANFVVHSNVFLSLRIINARSFRCRFLCSQGLWRVDVRLCTWMYLWTHIQMILMQGSRVRGTFTKPCWSQLLSKEHGSAFCCMSKQPRLTLLFPRSASRLLGITVQFLPGETWGAGRFAWFMLAEHRCRYLTITYSAHITGQRVCTGSCVCTGTKGHYTMSMHQKDEKILFIVSVKGSSREACQEFGCG